MTDKQKQKAGDNSQQIQAGVVRITNGIDEKRVREIIDEKIILELKNFSKEASQVAQVRIDEFTDNLLPKMLENNALSAFADPAFQILLQEAQKSAAASDRKLDYKMLSELMLDRFNRSKNNNVVIGISQAVAIINQIPDDALLGLTIFNAAERFKPQSGDMTKGLEILDNFFGKLLCNQPLPKGSNWLDQLDILKAIRVSFNDLGGTKKLGEYWYEKFDGYVKLGIKNNTKEINIARSKLIDAKLSNNLLIVNPVDKDYVKLPVTDKSAISSLKFNRATTSADGNVIAARSNITAAETAALESIYDMYDTDAKMSQEDFIKAIDNYNNLKILREWWDTLSSHSIEITAVGRVLSYANAQRIEPGLPKFEL